MKEIWKSIKGYEGLYQISNLGRVRSLDRYVKNGTSNRNIKRGKVLTPCKNPKCGYMQINLLKDTHKKVKMIHRLVAIAFISNPENKPCVNHIDGNKQNNKLDNLEWVTYSENTIHAMKLGLKIDLKGRNHYKRAVNQYSIDGDFIKHWESIKEAENALNASQISRCCKGKRKTVLGYKWKYA